MDNLSQNVDMIKNEADKIINEKPSFSVEIGDIQFEEIVDVDEIQKKLQEKLSGEISFDVKNEDSTLESSDSSVEKENEETNFELKDEIKSNAENEKNSPILPAFTLPVVENDPNAKKYVVYVDSENINFIEGLAINERRAIINKILREQNAAAKKKKELEARQKFLRHAILAAVTFIIGFPIMFFCVNKATQATINNYKDAKASFSRLYKEQGKVKSMNLK